jgi:hypothetical protein
MVGHPKLPFNDLSHASARPHVTNEAEGRGATREQGRQLSSLLNTETYWGTWRCAGAQSLDALGPRPGQPLADGTVSHTEGFGNLVLFPALLLEFPGAQASCFAPVLWMLPDCHEPYATRSTDHGLVLYAVVSKNNDMFVIKTAFVANKGRNTSTSIRI